MFIPLYLHCAGWEAGFGRLGWQTALADRTAEPILSKRFAVIFIHAMHAWGWATAILATALQRVDRTLEDAARLEGNEWSVFARVTLPQIGPALVAAAVWVGLFVAGEMTISNIYIVRTFAEETYTQFSVSSSSWSAIATMLPGTVLIAALAALPMALVPAWRISPMPRAGTPVNQAWVNWLAGVVVWISLAIVLAIPLANMIYKAGLSISVVDGAAHFEWSSGKLLATLSKGVGVFRGELYASAMLAAQVAAVATTLGMVLAWSMRVWPRCQGAIHIALALALALPAPIIGVLVIRLLNQPAIPGLTWLYDNTLMAPVVAILARALPLATWICWQAFAAVPQKRLDLARVEGVSTWMLLPRVIVPACWPAVVATFLATAAIAAGDLACSIMTLPPGVDTVAFRMFGFIHVGSDEQVCALGLLGSAMFAAMAIPAWRWFERDAA